MLRQNGYKDGEEELKKRWNLIMLVIISGNQIKNNPPLNLVKQLYKG